MWLNSYQQFVVNLALVYVLVALGFNMVIGYLGQLAFANAAFFGIGAYATGIAMAKFDIPFLGALCLSAVIGAVCGVLVGLPAFRGIRRFVFARSDARRVGKGCVSTCKFRWSHAK